MNGRIDLSRHRFWAQGEGSDHPLDRLVDQTEATVSVGVRQLCCREGTNARSFQRGRENLKQVGQIQVGEEQFRLLVESEGKAVLKVSQDEQLELDWSASQCQVQVPEGGQTTRLYASADGVLVPTITGEEKDKRRQAVLGKRSKMTRPERRKLKRLGAVKKGTDQRYKQIYLTSLFDQDQAHRLVGVTRKDARGLKKLLRQEAARVHLPAAAQRIGIVDGAVCLRNNLEQLPLQEVLLDFYHLAKHVNEAAAKILGAETVACKQWVAQTLSIVRHQGYKPFLGELMDLRSGLRGHKREAADDLIEYVTRREEMIRYEQCDQQGWHVGSGAMESMCGVTTDRIKGRGRRWDLDNAEAMMELEALYQSTGLWDRYWANALAHLN